jgi:hypothetical protein
MQAFSIRVTDFTGDMETLGSLNLIGPYASAPAREADLNRLNAIDELRGLYDFEACSLDAGNVGPDVAVTAPSRLANVRTLDAFAQAYIGNP